MRGPARVEKALGCPNYGAHEAEARAVSLLSRIEAQEAAGADVHRNRRFGMEAARAHCKARLRAEELKLAQLSHDDELTTTWIEVLDLIARDERLERLGSFA